MKDGFVKVGAVTPALALADTRANALEIVRLAKEAEAIGCKLLVTPELSLTGYTIADLVFSNALMEGALEALRTVRDATGALDVMLVVGLPLMRGGKLYNTAAVVHRGKVLALVPKTNIPNYGEFYEARWYTPAADGVAEVDLFGGKVPFGADIIVRASNFPLFALSVEICEDLWVNGAPSGRHAAAGATIIANPSASDEIVGKDDYRRSLVAMQSAKLCSAYVYCDAGEGESTTDMVFAGHDLIAENGRVLCEHFLRQGEILATEIDLQFLENERARRNTFVQETRGHVEVTTEFKLAGTSLTREWPKRPFVPDDSAELGRRSERIVLLQALGLKRRLEHTHAKTAVVGLSGGLDSTLALLVTAKAFDLAGRDRKDILAITMPCFGTTGRTRGNAEKLAEALGVSFEEVDIKASVNQHFKDIGQAPGKLDVTYENSQARERTQVLMDKANMTGGMVIGTGDLSELALGWATYNGDHMSMYAVNASVPKTLVRHLVGWMAENERREARDVLLDILDTPVSPELLPAAADGTIKQVTEDLVGPYDLHDFFLYHTVRCGFAPGKTRRLAVRSFKGEWDEDTIDHWLDVFTRRFFSQQFKRSCLPDGPKVGSVTLSPRSDWRMPSDARRELWRLDDPEERK